MSCPTTEYIKVATDRLNPVRGHDRSSSDHRLLSAQIPARRDRHICLPTAHRGYPPPRLPSRFRRPLAPRKLLACGRARG